jgi:heat-inducible transcriptional repressor
MDTRKEAILEAVVREYIETGLPVGSVVMVKKYDFPYSTATIRAEMAELERLGLLTHPHTSAGRIPTEAGYRYFVDLITGEVDLYAREEHAAQKRIAAMQGRFERQLEAASQVISDLTRNMGFAGYAGEIFSHGLSNLFSQPEFLDPYRILKVAELIDNLSILVSELPSSLDTRVYIGTETPIGKSAGCSMIVSRFNSPFGSPGYLGVIGPMRMNYDRGLAAIGEVKSILEKA